MDIQAYIQLSPKLQQEYAMTNCEFMMSISEAATHIVDLYYDTSGGFFIELNFNVYTEDLKHIESYKNVEQLEKFLIDIDLKQAYERLEDY
ncbi:hypothetical protein ACFLU5_03215 [Bacteroidota bacterium]